MGKKIVLFSDGTGNSAAKLTKTNVWRIFESLEKGPEQEPAQVAIYDNGVGTSTFRPLMLLGGVFGFGLKRNVRELYSFLCTHYEPGDEIYMFGFSRGAFTIRYLAAMITSEGILDVGYEQGKIKPQHIMKCSGAVYNALGEYFEGLANSFFKFRRVVSTWHRWFNFFVPQKGQAFGSQYEALKRHGGARHKARSFVGGADDDEDIDIRFIGIFDTVSAYGGPFEELTDAWSRLVSPIEPQDWNISAKVRKVCHALALDDPRQTFHPKLINEGKTGEWKDPGLAPPLEDQPKGWVVDERISQVWFAGAHSNVGGGYANDGLSFIPLQWMIENAEDAGLKFNKAMVAEFTRSQDISAPIYDPRKSMGGFYRYSPRDISKLSENFPKIYTSTPKIHHSVFDRISNSQSYAPVSLTRPYKTVNADGSITDGHAHDFTAPAEFGLTRKPSKALPLDQSISWNFFLQTSWDHVWKKRVFYFLTLFAALFLVAMRWLDHPFGLPIISADTPCSFWHCGLTAPLEWLKAVLPNFTVPWIDSMRANIGWTVGTVILIFLFRKMGTRQAGQVRSSIGEYWRTIISDQKPPRHVPKRSSIHAFRHNETYQAALRALKKRIIPGLLMAVIIALGVVVANKVIFSLRNAISLENAYFWDVCANHSTGFSKGADFDIKNPCHDTQTVLTAGNTYRVTLTKTHSWRDKHIPASLAGLDVQKETLLTRIFMKMGTAFRRHYSQPWFKPVLRVGGFLPEHLVLDPQDGQSQPKQLVSHITPNRSGAAHIYLNDAAFALFPFLLYDNNESCRETDGGCKAEKELFTKIEICHLPDSSPETVQSSSPNSARSPKPC